MVDIKTCILVYTCFIYSINGQIDFNGFEENLGNKDFGDDEYEYETETSKPENCLTPSGKAGICTAASTCPFSTLEDEENDESCTEETHICCKELSENNNDIIESLVANALESIKQNQVAKPNNVSEEDVEEALFGLRFGLADAVLGSENESDNEEITDIEDESNEDITPALLHLQFNKPRTDVLDVNRRAETLEHLQENLSTQTDDIFALRFFDVERSNSIDQECPWTPFPKCEKESEIIYRTIDGTCNNLNNTIYGKAGTPFQRILEAEYDPNAGKLGAPRISKSGFSLPPARKVSMTCAEMDKDQKSRSNVPKIETVMVMQMGQFIDHDITHSPTFSVTNCCNKDGSFPGTYDTNKCFPIQVPSDDPFWKGRLTCMNFVRSLSSPNLKCSLETRQQMNQITHWLDASNVYGSTNEESQVLRSFNGGKLKVNEANSRGERATLPICEKTPNSKQIHMCDSCPHCFAAGDVRANEQFNLILMHTVWVREHNRIAESLAEQHPDWNDEKLFQEARKITVAEYQHIIYNEWLPIILGSSIMTSFGLWPLSKGYSTSYMNAFDPRVTNEFASAAFRFGHSLIPTKFSSIRNSRIRGTRKITATRDLNLQEIFFKPKELQSSPAMLDDLVRGLTAQDGEDWDNVFSETVVNHLFDTKGSGGLDLVALNVQRGRDHGIPGYNTYREAVGIGKARDFDDLNDSIGPEYVEKLKKLYGHVDDIDLFVGGFLEQKHKDSLIGPIFKSIIADTFARIKFGDRFFYDLGEDKRTRFTESQLQQIRKTSMARVLCDNTNIEETQPQVFKMENVSKLNRRTFCDDISAIPRVDMRVF